MKQQQTPSELFKEKFQETYNHKMRKGQLPYTIKNGYATR